MKIAGKIVGNIGYNRAELTRADLTQADLTLSFFLSINTGTIKFWSLRQGVQFGILKKKQKQNKKTKTKQKNKKNLLAVFLTKWGVP